MSGERCSKLFESFIQNPKQFPELKVAPKNMLHGHFAQWRRQNFVSGTRSLSLSLPSRFPSPPSFPFLLPFPSLPTLPPLIQLGAWRSGSGRSPAAKHVLMHFIVKFAPSVMAVVDSFQLSITKTTPWVVTRILSIHTHLSVQFSSDPFINW